MNLFHVFHVIHALYVSFSQAGRWNSALLVAPPFHPLTLRSFIELRCVALFMFQMSVKATTTIVVEKVVGGEDSKYTKYTKYLKYELWIFDIQN